MPATRRGRQSAEKSKQKTAKWIASGGLKKAEAVLDGLTSELLVTSY